MKKSFFFTYHWLFLIVFSFVLTIPLLLPYFHPGYFPSHDGEWSVVRLTDMYRELKDFQIPARYSGNLNFGYGYPLFEFAYPLPYYLGIFIHLFHVNFVDSIKILFGLTIPLSFLGMYFLGKTFWHNRFAGYISGILYVYYPYRLVDLFVRGSIGESISFALFPFILYFLFRLHQSRKAFDAIYAGICIALLITAHNIMAVEFLPVILLFIASSWYIEKKNRKLLTMQYGLVLFLGFGLSCYFWLPALAEKSLIALSVIPIADRNLYFVQPLQLLLPSWGYGGTDISYQLGIPQLVGLIACLIAWKEYKMKSTQSTFIATFLFVLLFISVAYILLLFPASLHIWEHLPLFKDVTYPWTLLAPIGFFIAFFFGGLANEKRVWQGVAVVIILAAVIYNLPYAHPSSYVDRGDGFYLTNDATTTSSSEYTPLWVKQRPEERPADKFITLDKTVTLSNESFTSKMFTVTAVSTTSSLLQINIIYYPGWKVMMDGKAVVIHYQDVQGVMQVYLPKGTHTFVGTFTETPLRLLADYVTILSILTIIILFSKKLLRK